MDNCDYCDGAPPEWTYETAGRGWRFLCERCYDSATGIIQSYCEVYAPTRYYPRYNYVTKVVE